MSVIIISVILDAWSFVALLFSNGFVGAAMSRGSNIIGLPSYITDNLGEALFVLVPILFVVWVYVSSNKEKYPKFDIVMSVAVTIIFVIPWLVTFVTIKLSDQKFNQDKAAFEASGRIIQIYGCEFKIFPDNSSYQELGAVPGQVCTDPVAVWTSAYKLGETKY